MSEQPFFWHREEEFRATEDALKAGRGPESRPMHTEDVPTLAEAERDA